MVATNIQDLKGIGLEYLVDANDPSKIRIKFYDGFIIGSVPVSVNSEEPTLILEDL